MSSSLLTSFHPRTITRVMLLKYKSDCVRFLPKLLMTFQYLPDHASSPHRKRVPCEASSPTSVPHIQGSELCKSSPLGWWSSFSALCLYGGSAVSWKGRSFPLLPWWTQAWRLRWRAICPSKPSLISPGRVTLVNPKFWQFCTWMMKPHSPPRECGLDKATRP